MVVVVVLVVVVINEVTVVDVVLPGAAVVDGYVIGMVDVVAHV